MLENANDTHSPSKEEFKKLLPEGMDVDLDECSFGSVGELCPDSLLFSEKDPVMILPGYGVTDGFSEVLLFEARNSQEAIGLYISLPCFRPDKISAGETIFLFRPALVISKGTVYSARLCWTGVSLTK
jgi:hypothetical protein